jgi:segregation and condensation protein A
MELNIVSHQTRSYVVSTPVYEGPLDLLLQLIEKAELDITKLALSQITDQYLDHLHSLKELAAEEVSAFLVIAAKLIQIKSEQLLPRPPRREAGEEDAGEALAQQLIAYKRFKKTAGFLAQREASGFHTYLRLAEPPRIEGKLDLGGYQLPDMVSAARAIFNQTDNRPDLSNIISAPRITIREKISLIASWLKRNGFVKFGSLISDKSSRIHIVVTFLALLELIKRHMVQVNQQNIFGEIDIEASESWDESEVIDLEFGE